MSLTERQRVSVMLAAATLIPMGVLAWLGAHVIQQDRHAEGLRAAESLEVAAGRLALGVDRRLADIEETLARGEGVRLTPSGIGRGPDFSPLYQPASFVAFTEDLSSREIFEAAEALEYQRNDPGAAASAYRRLASANHPPAVRAAALVRLGGLLRNRGDRPGALQAYGDLERLGSVAMDGAPAALQARQSRARLYQQAGMREELRREAADLARTLHAGGWPINRATFDNYTNLLDAWGASRAPAEAVALTEAAIEMWEEWREGKLPARGRRVLPIEGARILSVWTGGPAEPVVWLGMPDQLLRMLAPLVEAEHLTAAVYDADSQPLIPDANSAASDGLTLAPEETRLPFILKVAPGAAFDGGANRTGRAVLIAGLALAFVVMAAAAYGLYRVTTREMALARQQSDFVSAVSHEFRTPLTSMRHLMDLLTSRGVVSEERKAYYYELIAHETERLHRMVESLLSFGRIEVGAYAWRLEPEDAGELARSLVQEFRREPQAVGREVTCDIDEPLAPIRADREAISRALWNLLENAAKYSEPGTPIRVFGRQQGDSLLLGVVDLGAGIPPEEREKVFQKFVRGADAKRAGIRGIGIGLALVQRIVEAHGGSVRLESEPGRGSTFTLVLPCHES